MATRRDFLKVTASIAAVGSMTATAATQPRRYGRLDVEGHRAHKATTGEDLHVYLDGVEVTDVYEADDVEGYVKVFCRDQEHHRALHATGAKHRASDHTGACRLEARGHVVIVPGVYR